MSKTQSIARLALLTTVACAAACAVPSPPPGAPMAEVVAELGPPTGRYALADGGQRLEYARGPRGRTTYMVDVDPQGKVIRTEQVLDDAHFALVTDGMPRDDLLRLLGRPAHRQREWMDKETWSWRFETNDCLWYRVTLSPEGYVMGGGGKMPDPGCDGRDRGRN